MFYLTWWAFGTRVVCVCVCISHKQYCYLYRRSPGTFKLRTFKDANVHLHVQPCKLAHVSGVRCHVCASSTSGAGNGKEIFFIWGVTVNFWGIGPGRRTVYAGGSGLSECNAVLLCHLWWEQKSYGPDITAWFSSRGLDRTESSKEPEPMLSTPGVSETAARPPALLLTILQLYHLSPPVVSTSSSLFTRCRPLYAGCCTILLYFSSTLL